MFDDEEVVVDNEEDTKRSPLKGWNGYIDRNGRFYGSSPFGCSYWNGSFFAHEDWAREYLSKLGVDIDSLKFKDSDNPFYGRYGGNFPVADAKDYLTEELGWTAVSASTFFGLESYVFAPQSDGGSSITQEESDTIRRWLEENDFGLEKHKYTLLDF
jgi:hypothetical protein